MLDTKQPRSNRRFTKRILLANMILIWALVFVSVVYQQAEHVIPGAMALIGTMFGFYTGIGHLDMRKAVELSIDRLTKGNKSYDA